MSALQIQRTSAASIDRHVKALVCGDPGSGKTLLSSTFPDPFYLTTEGLMMSLAERDIPYHKLKSREELLTAIAMLQQPRKVRAKQFGFPVETIVVDTYDDLSMMLLKERCRTEGHDTPQLQDYGWLKDQLTEITTALRNLDMNVVLTCHLKTQDAAGLTTFIPAIEGKFSEKIAGFVDIAVVLKSRLVNKVVGTDTVRDVYRFMQAIPDPQHTFIKDHSGKLPSEFPLNFENDYERIATIIYGAPPVVGAEEEEEAAAVDEAEAITVSNPKTESETAAPEAEEAPSEGLFATEETVTGPEYTCSSCGDTFTNEDDHDRGLIKFNKVLCRTCFNAERK